MEVGVAEPGIRDAVYGRRGYDAAEGAWCTETLVVRHNEKHVGCAFRRHDARRPPGRRLRGFLLDHTAKFWIGRWKLLSGDRCGGLGRAGNTGLLGESKGSAERQERRREEDVG